MLYGLDKDKVTGLTLGSFYLAPFDPYDVLYGLITPEEDKVPAKFAKVLAEAKKSERYVIPISHYPLACSGSANFCKNDRKTLKAYWDLILENDLSLYLGAHYHTYQRLYPYQRGDVFTTQED